MDLKVAQRRDADAKRESERHLPALIISWSRPEWGSVRVPDRKVETLRKAVAILFGKQGEDISIYERKQIFTWAPRVESHNYNIFDVSRQDIEARYSPVRTIK